MADGVACMCIFKCRLFTPKNEQGRWSVTAVHALSIQVLLYTLCTWLSSQYEYQVCKPLVLVSHNVESCAAVLYLCQIEWQIISHYVCYALDLSTLHVIQSTSVHWSACALPCSVGGTHAWYIWEFSLYQVFMNFTNTPRYQQLIFFL